MRHKSEIFEKFKEFQNEVENQHGKKIKALRSDCGDEVVKGLASLKMKKKLVFTRRKVGALLHF